MTTIRHAFSDAISVVLVGLRLSFTHLPTLLTIFLVGAAVRNGVLWGAVELSSSHPTLAGFVLPLAPMATLTAIVLMLRRVASVLTWATFGDGVDTQGRATPYLGLLASALVPFLTVYAAQGYLKEDLRAYVNEATYDEIFGDASSLYGAGNDDARAVIATGSLLVGIIAVALALRFLVSRLGLTQRHVGWGLVAAYVEVLWLFLLAGQFTLYQKRVWTWITERRFVAWVHDRWDGLIDLVGPLGRPLQSVADGVGNVVTGADAVLLIPIAWLTVGAVALGQKIDAPPRPRRTVVGPLRAVERVPPTVRRLGSDATADIRGRFSGLANGLRLLARGGLLPMLLFCLVFLIARQAGNLVIELWRSVVGPVQRDDALAFLPYLSVLSDAVYTVLLVGLLAAAIDRILGRRESDAAEAEKRSGDQLSGSSA